MGKRLRKMLPRVFRFNVRQLTKITHAIARVHPLDPSPATHAIFRLLKAGERVFLTLLLTKTVVHAPRGAQPLFDALFWRQNTV